MNQITIIGHLGNDAKVHVINNQNVINFSVAVGDDFKDAAGQWQQRTIWYSVSLWRDRVIDDLKKGTLVMAQGTPRINSYKNAQGVDVYGIQISAQTIKRLSKKEEGTTTQPTPQPTTNYPTAQPTANTFGTTEIVDDLPF